LFSVSGIESWPEKKYISDKRLRLLLSMITYSTATTKMCFVWRQISHTTTANQVGKEWKFFREEIWGVCLP
jgi:hypothetical protein